MRKPDNAATVRAQLDFAVSLLVGLYSSFQFLVKLNLITTYKDVERNFAHINHKGKKAPLFEFGIMPPVEMTDVDMKDATTPPTETTEAEPAKKDVDSITVEGIEHFSHVCND